MSNRAASLLSLKRYAGAATDSRRAVALAPTFGKAHARLGQALYFLKDYSGAVSAYEDAIEYEPENKVTVTYLEKARKKLSKQNEKEDRIARGEADPATMEEDMTVTGTVANSIATDPNASAAVVASSGFRGATTNAALQKAAGAQHPREIRTGPPLTPGSSTPIHDVEDDDPDFDEAVQIQQRANGYLANKQYKRAIEEYSAALFLVPDDPFLSPELHLGRAHALNGARRHESARTDAKLAIKWNPTAEAYSTLAKCLFYMQDFRGSIEAFVSCMDHLPEGEGLTTFDQAYLRKAGDALKEAVEKNPSDFKTKSTSLAIPKLPPPRFVPREQVRC